MNILEESRKMRKIIEKAVQSLTDDTALQSVKLHPVWEENVSYPVGFKVRDNDRLWRCMQAHTSLTGWEPDVAPSLWEAVNEIHTGTMEDPIPYHGNMALEKGKYYIQNGMIYMCIRDTVNPVYNELVALAGTYVEAI
jgi:hypothetical protein